MTKKAYIELMEHCVTHEMRPFLEQLVIPCDCDWEGCANWRLSTMLRAELPPAALATHRSHRRRPWMGEKE